MSICCRKLGSRRGAHVLFQDVEIELHAGDVLRVMGDNGSGKSTLLRTLAGLRPPDAGTVCWQGMDVYSDSSILRSELLYIGHSPGVKECLSALENLVFGELLVGPGARANALAALSHVGLASKADAAARTLSQGQRRRVALARLYLERRRALWILDEPFVGLDKRAVESLSNTMDAHRHGGGMIVYTTHQDAGPVDGRHLDLSAR